MNYRCCVDIGGTFTDLVMVNEEGEINIFKSQTTKDDYLIGLNNVLNLAEKYYRVTHEEFMTSLSFFSHGTTIATNALIEKNTVKVGLICTKGHRDILYFREAGKDNPFKIRYNYPEPYVPRYLTLSVTERIDAQGDIIIPLNEEEVREVVRLLKKYKVEVIAVSLLFSFKNPVHEKRIAEIIEEEWPGVKYTLSHKLNPIVREYRRTISTVIDASLKPIIAKYVSSLRDYLKNANFQHDLYMMSSFGGIMNPKEIIEKPIYLVNSGPALSPVAGLYYANKELNVDNVIVCDMGGTSFDLARIINGQISITKDAMVEEECLGIHQVDTKSIGAGGGSIARVERGILYVGPQGVKSEPGPACFMKGGTYATVTDANLVLGYLDEDYFLGGTMKISKKAAEKVIYDNVAKPLNLNIIEAAFAIWNTVNTNMTEAIKNVTIWEGIDPRDFIVVVGGGAIGLHIAYLVGDFEIKRIIVPKTSATLSAFGGVVANIVTDYNESYFCTTKDFDYEGVNRTISQLEKEAKVFLDKAGVPPEKQLLEYYVEACYPSQARELTICLNKNKFNNESDVAELVNNFNNFHEQTLGSKEESQYIECTVWKIKATGFTRKVVIKENLLINELHRAEAIGIRKAYFRELGGMIETPIYRGSTLLVGNKIKGPAIIEEEKTSVLLSPNSIATVSKYGSHIIDIL